MNISDKKGTLNYADVINAPRRNNDLKCLCPWQQVFNIHEVKARSQIGKTDKSTIMVGNKYASLRNH